ncbi:MAG: DJ-1/PfpI family protein [Clostridiaceae bacterium]|nr:DJ-1/PfpI family protein [Clostridiaceae bacterium]
MNINILLFDDFETLDAFGPAEVLGRVEQFSLHFISESGGLVKSRQGILVMTKPLVEADASGVLLVPGGQGTRALVKNKAFLKNLSTAASLSSYCLTVCTGSALLAATGLLDGVRATSNKKAFDWVVSVSENVQWVPRARWAVDGKFYTSSGVSAGIDMSLGFVADMFGIEKAENLAYDIEYIWNRDRECDPFARV